MERTVTYMAIKVNLGQCDCQSVLWVPYTQLLWVVYTQLLWVPNTQLLWVPN